MTDACVQLHCHCSYSFKDGQDAPEKLVARAAELGQPGMGLTDHGHTYAAPRFFSACRQHNIKGVIGMEIYEAVPHTIDPDPDHWYNLRFKEKYDPTKPRYFHLTLWAMDQTGWENLCALHTLSYTPVHKPKNQPLIDRASLEKHSAGLICGLGCPASRTNQALARDGFGEALRAAEWYFAVFEDRCYVEVMAVLSDQVRALPDQRKLAKHYGRPTVGVNDVHYALQEDGVEGGPHHTLVKARKFKSSATAEATSGDKSDESYGSWYGSDGFYLKSRTQMMQSGIFPDEVDTGLEILDRVSFDFLGMDRPKPPLAHVPGPGADPDFDAWLSLHT